MPPFKESQLREEFKKRFDGYWRGEAIPDEICFWWLSKMSSSQEALIGKIESMKYVFERPKEDYLPEVYKHLKSKNEAFDHVLTYIREQS